MSDAKTAQYDVLVPFPRAGGQWAEKGETVSLHPAEAAAWLRTKRIKPASAKAPAKATKATKDA